MYSKLTLGIALASSVVTGASWGVIRRYLEPTVITLKGETEPLVFERDEHDGFLWSCAKVYDTRPEDSDHWPYESICSWKRLRFRRDDGEPVRKIQYHLTSPWQSYGYCLAPDKK